uniref:Uncharacterized protein n=1 Tax=Oryza barthii TaxID=65489 RepID=A0A0D3FML7_9ORYZ
MVQLSNATRMHATTTLSSPQLYTQFALDRVARSTTTIPLSKSKSSSHHPAAACRRRGRRKSSRSGLLLLLFFALAVYLLDLSAGRGGGRRLRGGGGSVAAAAARSAARQAGISGDDVRSGRPVSNGWRESGEARAWRPPSTCRTSSTGTPCRSRSSAAFFLYFLLDLGGYRSDVLSVSDLEPPSDGLFVVGLTGGLDADELAASRCPTVQHRPTPPDGEAPPKKVVRLWRSLPNPTHSSPVASCTLVDGGGRDLAGGGRRP